MDGFLIGQLELLDRREDDFTTLAAEERAQFLDAVCVLDLPYQGFDSDELIVELAVNVGAIHLDDEGRVFHPGVVAEDGHEVRHRE